MSNFTQRFIITITLGPLALFLVYLGGLWFAIPIAAILAMATYEFAQMGRNMGWTTSAAILVPLVLLFYINAVINVMWADLEINLVGPVTLFSMLVIMAYALWRYEYKEDKSAPAIWMAMTAGLLIMGWLGSHFFLLRGLEDNDAAWRWTMVALLAPWMADSAAYVVGRFLAGNVLGKHYMAPRLSPNKTIEGYVGGIVIGTAITVLVAYLLGLPWLIALLLGLLVSIFAPLGDLGISLLKREAGVKDSGAIFRSHGGALDRVDTPIWSLTIAYYLVIFITL